MPNVLSPIAILSCCLGVGLLIWALYWRHVAGDLAYRIASDFVRDFGIKQKKKKFRR